MGDSPEKHGKGGVLSFALLLATAFVELILLIFHFTGGSWQLLRWLEGVIFALMSIVIAAHAWSFVKGKKVVWKLLYFVLVLAVIAFVVLPRIF